MKLVLFSEPWMREFGKLWTNDREISSLLQKRAWTANIGYGLSKALHPNGILMIENSQLRRADDYNGQSLDWDMRASLEDWQKWLENGFSIDRMGYVLVHKELQFVQGDYRKVMCTPMYAALLLRSFELMQQLPTHYPQHLQENAA